MENREIMVCKNFSLDQTDPGISNLKRWHNLLMSQELFLKTEFEVAGGKEVSSFKVCTRINLAIHFWYILYIIQK